MLFRSDDERAGVGQEPHGRAAIEDLGDHPHERTARRKDGVVHLDPGLRAAVDRDEALEGGRAALDDVRGDRFVVEGLAGAEERREAVVLRAQDVELDDLLLEPRDLVGERAVLLA